jgi:hypothetical protein
VRRKSATCVCSSVGSVASSALSCSSAAVVNLSRTIRDGLRACGKRRVGASQQRSKNTFRLFSTVPFHWALFVLQIRSLHGPCRPAVLSSCLRGKRSDRVMHRVNELAVVGVVVACVRVSGTLRRRAGHTAVARVLVVAAVVCRRPCQAFAFASRH